MGKLKAKSGRSLERCAPPTAPFGAADVTDALLPCPFCGSAANGPASDSYGCWIVGCNQCDMEATRVFETPEEGIAAWNRRAPSPERAQLEEALHKLRLAQADLAALRAAWKAGEHLPAKAAAKESGT